MAVQLTICCKAPVYTKCETEYPLGGRTWSISTSAPACEACGEEHPETFNGCECCGEREGTIPTELGDYCETCAEGVKVG